MFKLLLILLCLTSFNSFASIITHSKSDLSDSAYILAMNNQQYGEQYQKIMYLIKNDELGKAKQALAFLLTQNPFDTIALDISGNILLAERKLPEALEAFKRALSQAQSPDIMAKLGVTYLLMGENNQAKTWLTQSLSLSPHNRLALRYLAWMEEQTMNNGGQLHYLSQLVKLSDNDPRLHEYHFQYLSLLAQTNQFELGLSFINHHQDKLSASSLALVESIKLVEIELLLKANQLDKAKEKFEQFKPATLNSELSASYHVLSVFYYAKLKQYETAESLITSKFTEGAEKSLAQYSLAEVYFEHNDFSSAQDILKKLLASESKLAEQMKYIDSIIATYSMQSRYGDAIKFLQVQIDKNPAIPHYQHQLAELYIISGRSKNATKQLDYMLVNFPEYIPSFIVKGRQLIKKSDADSISSFYDIALAKHATVSELWLDYAKYFWTKGNKEQSLKVLEKATESITNNLYLYFELATMYDYQNQLEKSEPLYIKVLQQSPEYLPALDNLASNYFTLNHKLDIAVVLAKRAYLLSPNDAFIKNLRAQAYLAENKFIEAIELLTPIIDEFGQSGLGHFTLANAHKSLDQTVPALEHLDAALSKELPELIKNRALELQKKWREG